MTKSFILMATLAALGIFTFLGLIIYMSSGNVNENSPTSNNTNISGYYGGASFPHYNRIYYEGPRLELTSTPQPYKIPLGAYYDFWDDDGRKPTFNFEIQNSKNGKKINSNNVYHVPTETIWVSYSGTGRKFVTFAHTWH